MALTTVCGPGCLGCPPDRPGAAAAARLLGEAQAAVLATHPCPPGTPPPPALLLLDALRLAALLSGPTLRSVLATLPGPRPGPITHALTHGDPR